MSGPIVTPALELHVLNQGRTLEKLSERWDGGRKGFPERLETTLNLRGAERNCVFPVTVSKTRFG